MSSPSLAPARLPEPDPGLALQAQSLYRFFRAGEEEILALQGVSLSVRAGEIVAVVGPSGSGKSTLLSCLAGLDEPDGGNVWVDGRRVSHQAEAIRARLRARHIGLMFQSANLFEHLTAEQNVGLAQSLADRPRHTPPAQLLQQVGLAARTRSYPSQLSGGEYARAALAVALANEPAVLLADEPTGELDTTIEAGILGLLRDRAADGLAVLVASHSPAVAKIADRMIRIVDGHVIG